jgi:hypothetical protein
MNVYKINPDFDRDLACYTRMVDRLNEHGINLVGISGHTLEFKKNGKTLNHSIDTWQCVPDPTRPAFTEDLVVDWVLHAFKDV